MTHGEILLLMTALFLIFGYMGVPVVFALMAGVLTACLLTPISMQSLKSCWPCRSFCWSAN